MDSTSEEPAPGATRPSVLQCLHSEDARRWGAVVLSFFWGGGGWSCRLGWDLVGFVAFISEALERPEQAYRALIRWVAANLL